MGIRPPIRMVYVALEHGVPEGERWEDGNE